MSVSTVIDQVRELARIDFAPRHRPPSAIPLVVATAAALVGSVVADVALVALGTHLFPSTRGYVHFAALDYSKLTIIGVVIAAGGWAVVTRVSSSPRWLYLRAAVVTTLVLFLPDVWLLLRGSSLPAVLVLMAMHVAIALVTYQSMVRMAPVRAVQLSSLKGP
jgi:hypothetical protein